MKVSVRAQALIETYRTVTAAVTTLATLTVDGKYSDEWERYQELNRFLANAAVLIPQLREESGIDLPNVEVSNE